MKALVTGASGFIGSHTVKALCDAGHEVRASGRSAARVRGALDPLGCSEHVEVVAADLTQPEDVEPALRGCEAIVHSAAVYSHDARRRRDMLTQNPRSTELVLTGALELGFDPIVVSSYVALLPADGPLTSESAVGRPPTAYARSKARSEEIARRLQAAGAPVTITYPGVVFGPADPAFGESALLVADLVAGKVPLGVPGTIPVVDVRDVASVHAAALTPGHGPRRYIVTAEVLTMAEVMRTICAAAARKPPRGTVPAPVILAMGRVADAVQRVAPERLPLDYQSVWTALHGPQCDPSVTIRELGVAFRPAAETLTDTVRWLAADPAPVA